MAATGTGGSSWFEYYILHQESQVSTDTSVHQEMQFHNLQSDIE
jgi:hypothetical protein